MDDKQDDQSDTKRNPYLPPSNGAKADSTGQQSREIERDNPYQTSIRETTANRNDPNLADSQDLTNSQSSWAINGFCWVLIVLIMSFVFLSQSRKKEVAETESSPQRELVVFVFQAKILVGMKNFLDELGEGADDFEQLDLSQLAVGSVRNRHASSVLIAELNSKSDALRILKELADTAAQQNFVFSETQTRLNELLTRLFESEESIELTANEKELLQKELLWFGELAQNLKPKIQKTISTQRESLVEGAKSKFYFFFTFGVIGVLSCGVGLLGMIGFIKKFLTHQLTIRTIGQNNHPSIFLESFTVWFVSFIAFGLLFGQLSPGAHPVVVNLGVFILSLVSALMWPVIRGVEFGSFASQIALRGNWFKESVWGVWCYVCSLPLVAAGMLVSNRLMVEYTTTDNGLEQTTVPEHPVLGWVLEGDTTTLFLIAMVTCVFAPLTEEMVFRGMFYRHLRDKTNRWGHAASVIVSALINGLIFALIHPQGILYVPVLLALAIAFSLAREWRGSIAAPIAMHFTHNALITAMLFFVIVF